MTNRIEAEYEDITNRNAWPLVYQRLGRQCQTYPYTCNEAKKIHNKSLNRYRDVNPYDHTRVALERCERDYINANLVKMDRAQRQYILTQGPLPYTVSHFWLMVWEQKSRAILMLNKVVEKHEIKCHWYWPRGNGPEHRLNLTDVRLTVEQLNEEDCNYYSTRKFRVTDTDTTDVLEVIQFHYTTWPDFGVPSSPVAFLAFLDKVRASGALDPEVGPAVVHCSAGIGRSGTFCLVDSCLVIIQNEGMDNVNIQEILLEMRKDRMGLIQTPDQLRFSYQAIIEGSRSLNLAQLVVDEGIYADVNVDRDDDAPPPPPPRAASLTRAPARPLPAIPTSTSLGNMSYPASQEESSDEGPPTPPPRGSPSPPASTASSSADDEDDEPPAVPTASEDRSELRRRHTRELADRVSAMKRRARDAENWHALKRSLYKPLTITFGVLLAGIIVYSYVKH